MKEYMKTKILERFLAIKRDGVTSKLEKMGYSTELLLGKGGSWVFIVVYIDDEDGRYGKLIYGQFNEETDIILDIEDVPLRKDLNDYVKVLNEGTKLGLL